MKANSAGFHFWLTLAIAALAPLPYGSVGSSWITIWVLASAAALALAPMQGLHGRQGRVIGSLLALWCGYMVVALAQIFPDPPLLANEIWRETSDLLGAPGPERISVRESLPMDAAARATLAMLAFCNGFIVGAQNERAERFLDWMRVAGLLYAAYSILAEIAMPSRLLLRAKAAYGADMTGTFVNRNTAATFFGVIAALWFFSVLRNSHRIRLYSGRLMLIVPQNARAVRSLALRAIALVICIAALVGTHSRAGALAFGCALATTGAVVSTNRGRLLAMSGAVALVLILGALGGGIGGRIASEGVFDGGRWTTYVSALELVLRHPLLGTGLGSFSDVFPSVRSSADPAQGVWEMAHNTILEIAVEMGLPVALAIVFAALWIVRAIYEAALASEGRRRADLLALASVAVLGFTHSLSDFSLQIPGFLTPFAALLGAALAVSSAERERA